tara:strand:- start:239 stop:352 length:114 start_codon:yes stop_codon:yes gene_type:complete
VEIFLKLVSERKRKKPQRKDKTKGYKRKKMKSQGLNY